MTSADVTDLAFERRCRRPDESCVLCGSARPVCLIRSGFEPRPEVAAGLYCLRCYDGLFESQYD